MAEAFDVIVIGMGPGGEEVADRVMAAGRRVAVVERELVGGECAYWACIPSKTLLRPTEVWGEARRAQGVGAPALDWSDTAAYRDELVRHLDDAGQVEKYEQRGATVVRGAARLTGPGTVEVDGRELRADHVVIATGTHTAMPPVEGLGDVPLWTNREATTLREIPDRAVFIGGGPVAVELAQLLRRFGAEVTVVQGADGLVDREDPKVGELLAGALRADGIEVRTGVHATRARRDGDGAVLELDDGSEMAADVVVVAAGRAPNTADLGLDAVGLQADEHGALPIDDAGRAGDGVWAVGDVTGVMAFTHVALYQGRVVAENILGGNRRADYRGIPRVVFTDPEVAAVGLTAAQARDAGIDVVTADVDLARAIARPVTYEREPRGNLGLVADRERRVLVGAWAVAPLSSEWIHTAAMAIRAEVPIDTLLDSVAQFPTFNEGYLQALEALEL